MENLFILNLKPMIEPLPPVNPDMYFASKINELIEVVNRLELNANYILEKAEEFKKEISKPSDINRRFFDAMAEKKNEYHAFVSEFLNKNGAPQTLFPETARRIDEFVSYWTERSKSGKQRWELEKTFEVDRRLARWFKNDFGNNKFAPKNTGVIIS